MSDKRWIGRLAVGEEIVELVTRRRFRVKVARFNNAILEEIGGNGELRLEEWHRLRIYFERPTVAGGPIEEVGEHTQFLEGRVTSAGEEKCPSK